MKVSTIIIIVIVALIILLIGWQLFELINQILYLRSEHNYFLQ